MAKSNKSASARAKMFLYRVETHLLRAEEELAGHVETSDDPAYRAINDALWKVKQARADLRKRGATPAGAEFPEDDER